MLFLVVQPVLFLSRQIVVCERALVNIRDISVFLVYEAFIRLVRQTLPMTPRASRTATHVILSTASLHITSSKRTSSSSVQRTTRTRFRIQSGFVALPRDDARIHTTSLEEVVVYRHHQQKTRYVNLQQLDEVVRKVVPQARVYTRNS